MLAMTRQSLTAYSIEIVRAGLEAVSPASGRPGTALGHPTGSKSSSTLCCPRPLPTSIRPWSARSSSPCWNPPWSPKSPSMDLDPCGGLDPVAHLSAPSRPISSSPWSTSVMARRPAPPDARRRAPALRRQGGAEPMIELTALRYPALSAAGRALDLLLLSAHRLSSAAAIGALFLLLLRYARRRRLGARFLSCYVEVFQGTPLLMQLFLAVLRPAAAGHRRAAARRRRHRADALRQRLPGRDLARLRRWRSRTRRNGMPARALGLELLACRCAT